MLKKYQLRSYNIRLVIALLITSGFGIIVINSANSAYTIRQCIGLAISLFLMAAVSFIDYNWILKYYWLIYIVNLAALLAVKLFGHESHGAKRWIKVPLIGQFHNGLYHHILPESLKLCFVNAVIFNELVLTDVLSLKRLPKWIIFNHTGNSFPTLYFNGRELIMTWCV